MATDLSQPAHSALPQHLPYPVHGCHIPFEVAVEASRVARTMSGLIAIGAEQRSWLRSIATGCHGCSRLWKTDRTTSVCDALDPWSLLRKLEQDAFKLALCLLVHGHVGGVVPVFICSLAL